MEYSKVEFSAGVFDAALAEGKAEIVEWMINQDFSKPPFSKIRSKFIPLSKHNINKVLMIACKQGNLKLAKIALGKGADANWLHNSKSPLFSACGAQEECVDLVLLLLENGAEVNRTYPSVENDYMSDDELYGLGSDDDEDFYDYEDYSPLMAAINNDFLATAKILVERGVIVRDEALIAAAEAIVNSVELMELLVQKGADVSARVRQFTPLQNAVNSGNIKAVKFLLAHGALVFRLFYYNAIFLKINFYLP